MKCVSVFKLYIMIREERERVIIHSKAGIITIYVENFKFRKSERGIIILRDEPANRKNKKRELGF